jgi:type IV pilus assembly protein PilW
MKALNRFPRSPRGSQAGLSLVELLVAVALGLLVMAGLAALFANTSAARNELERSARQIENGRFAMEILSDELRQAGFYGEHQVAATATIAAVPDVCATTAAEWAANMAVAVQHFDNGVGVPPCITGSRKGGTDVIAVRRVSTCEAGVGDCPNVLAGQPYIQVAKCATETPTRPFILDRAGAVPFNLTLRDCAGAAKMRRYIVRVFYIATDNGNGQSIPTLTRVDFNGNSFDAPLPLVEGIEELNVEYGLDFAGQAATPTMLDGQPDAYYADPTNYVNAACLACAPVNNLTNIVTARIHLLARNIDPSPNYTDNKTYSLGLDRDYKVVEVTPGGAYRRHAYTGLVRIVNVSQRRERPI